MNNASDSTTLTCLPTGICAWNFFISDERGMRVATLSFVGFFGRPILGYQGAHFSIFPGHTLMRVHPRSFLSGGDWIEGTAPVAVAHIALNAGGAFEIKTSDQTCLLQPSGLAWEILVDGVVHGTIQRVHPRTKRSIVTCDAAVPMLVQLFCLGLLLERWRKESDSD